MKLYLTWNDALIKTSQDRSPELKYVTKQEESKNSPSAAAFTLTADMTDSTQSSPEMVSYYSKDEPTFNLDGKVDFKLSLKINGCDATKLYKNQ